MPVETLQHLQRKPARTAAVAPPPRLRPKGQVGPDLHRQCLTAVARPKQSAVERLEADKSKYVKSQVALSRQQPARAAEARKPPLNAALQPTRKTPTKAKTKDGIQLDLQHLSNLISDVHDGPPPGAAVRLEGDGAPEDAAAGRLPAPLAPHQIKERPCPPPRPDWSSPAKVRLKSSDPPGVEGPGPSGSPAVGTVRRVDVMPQASPVRMACRPPQFIRKPLQPIPLHSQFPLRPAVSNLRLFHTRTLPGPSHLKPLVAPSKPDAAAPAPSPPSGSPVPAPPPPNLPAFPPASPAITRLSSSSSRKRPSLTRSKSDMSDRYSRAGTDLERFFNLCGLDPSDLHELSPGAGSDIVSLARFRSVSAPGSECAASDREEEEEEEEEDGDKAAARVPYGVSVIERNARVIKWLYGLRQAKDAAAKSTNL